MSDSDINLRASDPLNYQLPGDVSLMFLPEGKTAEADWEDLGDIVSSSLAPSLKQLEHFSIRRGQRAKDRVIVSERSAQLNFSIDEINTHNLKKAFGIIGDPTAETVERHDDKIVVNPGPDAPNNIIKIKRLDITPGSVVIRRPQLSEDQTPFVEGTDYTVDYPAGEITILDSGALADKDLFPKLHVQWSENFASNAYEIFPGTETRGSAKFQIFTPGGIKYMAVFNNVIIKNNGDINFGDGSTWQQIPLTMDCLVDEDGVIGMLHVIDED